MIEIILDNQPPIYPGHTLQGKVICSFKSDTSLRSIKIRCYGKEHTEWHGGNTKKKTTYRGTHYFFQMETKLFEPEDYEIKSGTYTYPFTFLLPHSLPTTLEFPYGYIRYSLKGIVDLPMAVDPRDRMDLAVVSVLDIATLPTNLRLPSQVSQESLMGCCWFYNTEPVKVDAQLNKLVFLPGELIKINIEVSNMSNNGVENVTVKLTRCFVAHSETPRHDMRYVNEDLVEVKLDGLGAHSQRTYEPELRIPTDIAIPNTVECQLIEILYRIVVIGVTSGFTRNLDVVLAEVKIGHVDGGSWTANTPVDTQYSKLGQLSSYNSGYPYPSAPAAEKLAVE